MKRITDDLKKLLDKDITNFVIKYKLPLIVILVATLLTCAGFIFSYAFYQVATPTPIVGITTGKIADLEIRVMAEERDTNGNGLNSYALYPYIPRAGYSYNASKSKCTNGSVLAFNEETFEVNVTATGHDVCYVYFDSTASLDLTLNVYAENIDNNGVGTGEYTKLETTALPSIGYTLARSSCANGSSVSYNADENMFTVEASGKDTCDVYMDAIDVDIALKILLQAKKGSSEYYEAKSIPDNIYYTLNTDSNKSTCTGTSTLSLVNQRVVISATGKTSCVAYLDVSTGPIIESASLSDNGRSVTLNSSNSGTTPSKYYFSNDGGENFVESKDSTYTFNNVNTEDEVKTYAVDATGKTSAIKTVTADEPYVFEGNYPYSSSVKTVTIEETGYYRLEVWGAQGGSFDSTYVGGKGGFSTGIVHLNKNDKLYIHTGGQPSAYNKSATAGNTNAGGVNGGGAGRTYSSSGTTTYGLGGGGATDIRINTDSLYARVIVAGGGSGSTNLSSGYAGGGTSGAGFNSNYYGSQTAAGIGGSFGIGGSSSGLYDNKYGSSGAGGGWYGGGAGTSHSNNSEEYAKYSGGGSGYIYTEATMTNYPNDCLLTSVYYLTSASTVSGTTSFNSPVNVSEIGHSGNGYAKVTYIGNNL